jgi:16S rRNA (cytosine1402-N4)-methyltransferase
MHIPVLKKEMTDTFAYLGKKDGIFVDGTLGAGGHSIELAKKFKNIKFIGIDKDEKAIETAARNIEENNLTGRFTLIHNDFSKIDDILKELNIKNIIGALLDLGVSSMQLDEKNRGFSFENPEAILDMRMDQRQSLDARTILNTYPKWEIERILKEYGEERYAKSIAQNIAQQRTQKHFQTVGDLLQVLASSIPSKIIAEKRKNFATNTFRALRMEVNNEVGELGNVMESFVDLLAPKSRLVVIAFHSIEDRIIKNAFKKMANPCQCPPEIHYCVCGKKPKIIAENKAIMPTEDEIRCNPRSRSAKLRVATKI